MAFAVADTADTMRCFGIRSPCCNRLQLVRKVARKQARRGCYWLRLVVRLRGVARDTATSATFRRRSYRRHS
jgi:hypothetical protein